LNKTAAGFEPQGSGNLRQAIGFARLKNGPATVVADNAYHATERSRLGRQATDEAMSQETDRLRQHHILRGKGVRRMHAFGYHRNGCGLR